MKLNRCGFEFQRLCGLVPLILSPGFSPATWKIIVNCKSSHKLCSSFRQRMELVFPPLEPRLALLGVLANRMWQTCSVPGPSLGLQIPLLSWMLSQLS